MDATTHAHGDAHGTTDATLDAALTSPLHLPHAAAECPKCFTELQQNHNWWSARPEGSRLVGLVVARDGMPSVVQQREDLTRFGVPIDGFRHPHPTSWRAGPIASPGSSTPCAPAMCSWSRTSTPSAATSTRRPARSPRCAGTA